MVEELLDLRNNLGEDLWMIVGELRKHFAIDGDFRDFEFAHEDAVAHPIDTGGGVDPDLPELAELTLLQAAVLIGMTTGPGRGGLGFLDLILPAPLKTLGDLENIFSPLDVGDTSFYAHGSLGIRE